MTRRAGVVMVTVILATVMAPVGVGAQEERVLQDYELDFQAALTTFEAAEAAEEVASRRLARAMQELDAARSSGDQDRANEAFSAMLEASDELQRQNRRVQDTRERLNRAGRDLVTALVERRSELLAESDSLPPERAGEAREIGILLVDLTNRIREVEAEVARPVDEGIPGLPAIRIAATDGREEIELKARFLEARAAQFDSTLVEIDGRIEALRQRQRDDRRVRDLVSTIRRFDDNVLPGIVRSDEAGSDADEALPLTERIEGLTSLRRRIVDYREWALDRARSFRRRIPGSGSGGFWVA